MPVAYKAHGHLRTPQRTAQRRERARGRLAPVGLEEFQARGGVVEEIADDHRRPLRTAAGGHVLYIPAVERDERAHVRAAQSCFQLYARHGGDRRERLAAKAHRAYRLEPALIVQLAGRVAQKRHARVLARHARAVVRHADVGRPAAAYLHGHVHGARIEGVFHQLLYHRRRTLDDLARRYHVRHMGGEYIDHSHTITSKKPNRHQTKYYTLNLLKNP